MNELQHHKNVVNVINFKLIDAKISENKYKSCPEFLDDILWMEHNSIIVGNFGKVTLIRNSSYFILSFFIDSSDRIKRITKEFIEYCRNEILFIESCELCYALASLDPNLKWFAEVCAKKHPVVWAKVIGFPYEPAKMIDIKNEIVTVHFFGDHKIAHVSPKYCIKFTEKSPNQNYTLSAKVTQVKILNSIFVICSVNIFRFVDRKHRNTSKISVLQLSTPHSFKNLTHQL